MRKILLFAGLGSALGAIGAGHLYLSRLEDELAGGAKVPILVAAKDAPAGTILTQQQLIIRDIPEAYLDTRTVRASDVKQVVGNRLSVGLKAQQSLLWSDLATFTDQGRLLSSLVEKGLRAVEIESKVSNFDGLLRPGDRVDILFSADGGGNGSRSTVTLLQNLLVLSVGGSMERTDSTGAGTSRFSVSRGVTVGATLAQAQIITQAKSHGSLALTLRNPDDVKTVDGLPETTDKEVTEAHLSASNNAPSTARKAGEH
jgi:pilus assembly protein CpaB